MIGKKALPAAILALALAAFAATDAQAAARWRIDSLANTTAAPGTDLEYIVTVTNVGDEPAPATTGGDEKNCAPGSPPPSDPSKCWTVEANFPPGITPLEAETGGVTKCPVGPAKITCPYPANGGFQQVVPSGATSSRKIVFRAHVAAGASGTLTSSFQVSGAGVANAPTTVDPTRIEDTPPGFGIDSFDAAVSADAEGTPFTQAGGHPYSAANDLSFNILTSPYLGPRNPAGSPRDIAVDLPAGFLGNPTAAETCSIGQLANGVGQTVQSTCPPESQVGAVVGLLDGNSGLSVAGPPLPLFNMEPPPGAPARLGFNLLGTVVLLDATVRSDGDYGLRVAANGITQFVVPATEVTIWGVPADPVHDHERACSGFTIPQESGKSCESTAPLKPFLRNPTSCTAPGTGLTTSVSADSWGEPGVFVHASTVSHQPPGFPYPAGPSTFPADWSGPTEQGAPVGIDGCAAVPFEPQITATPTTEAADAPSGLDVDLTVPQDCWDADQQSAICQSDLKDADVKLPAGMSLNPAAAGGLGSCSPRQIGLITPTGSTPIHFNQAPASCPDSSKIGDVTITTPLLSEPLKGFVYLAKQSDNPFNSLLAMYLVAEGSGVVIKQAGQIEAGPGGQLTTAFSDAPQTPFSDLHVSLYPGARAPLRTPPACGTYTTRATLTPWSGNAAVDLTSDFQIARCPAAGFDPKLSAGTTNPLAGTTSPFILRLTREDGMPEFTALNETLPPGLSGYLKGIPYCPDSALASISDREGTGAAQIASPSCPAASQIGTVTAGAGAGPNPFYTSAGRAYLAGPYKGAPLSIAVVGPAVAGPFDLGNIVVRNALRINPETAQITVLSDPIPTILHGIPLDLRDIRVELDRPNFTLNPTSCEPMSITSLVGGTGGASASPSNRFQAGGCERLAFKPKLTLALKGKTKRSGNPALTATLTMPRGGANIARARVGLPHSEFLAQAHIRTVCTRVQYVAGGGGGAGCPAGSVYGRAIAFSPLLDQPLQGPVFLRSNPEHELPDLVASLGGQIQVDLVGRIDSHNGGIRTTFDTVPDAPVSKFVLKMPGGKKSLLENSTNICRGTHKATVAFDAQNGKIADSAPALAVKGCGKGRAKPKKGR